MKTLMINNLLFIPISESQVFVKPAVTKYMIASRSGCILSLEIVTKEEILKVWPEVKEVDHLVE